MLGFTYFSLCGVLAICLTSVTGLTNEERGAMRSVALPYIVECAKEYGVTEKDSKAAVAAGTVEYMDPCFVSCVLKKVGMFNTKGMFDKEKTTMLATTLLSDEQQNALDVIHACASINDQTVSDGENGCERATLWTKCYMSHKKTLPGTP